MPGKPPFNAHERQVIEGAIRAHGLVENHHFLPSPGRQKAARNLVERGFLTDVTSEAGIYSFGANWIVVKIDKDQVDRANAALTEAARN
jgi:hypothetical protein